MASTVSFRPKAAGAPAPAQNPAPAPVTPPVSAPVLVKQAPAPAQPPVEATLAAAQEPVTQAPAASTAIVPAPDTQVANIEDQYSHVGGFIGEWSPKDMATPYLTIVGKTSKAFDVNPEWLGQWVYDKAYPLGTELRVVFISATKWIVEDLPFGTQQIAQRFSRMSDARAAGFNEGNLKDTAELDLLIEVPIDVEGAADMAHIIEGDKGYILARYSVQSTAFGKTASILAKDMSGFLRGCMFSGFYTMITQVKTGQKGTYYIPVLKTDGKTPVGLKQQIVERMSAVTAKAA
jgi:hypothetical protein